MAWNSKLYAHRFESSLMFFVFLRTKIGDMLSTTVGTFAHCIARTIVQREVAVAHEAVDSQNMKVVVLPRFYTVVDFYSFPSSSCLVFRPKNRFALLLAGSIRKVQRALHSGTLRRCGSYLRHKSSLNFTDRSPRMLELMAARSSTKNAGDTDIDTDPLPSKRWRTQ